MTKRKEQAESTDVQVQTTQVMAPHHHPRPRHKQKNHRQHKKTQRNTKNQQTTLHVQDLVEQPKQQI